MKTRFLVRATPVAAALALLLSGCAGGAEEATSGESVTDTEAEDDGATESPTEPGDATSDPEAAAPEKSKITLGIIPIANLTPVYVAQEEGFFEEVGLEVETTSGSAGAGLAAALSGGSLDLAYTNYVSVFQANAGGFDLQIVAHQNSAAESSPDAAAMIVAADSDVAGPADLAGATIGVNGLNNINFVAAQHWLEEAGVDPASVTFVEVPFPSMGDALTRGDVDAAYQVEPFVTILEQNGVTKAVGYPFIDVYPGLPIAGYVGTSSFIEENPNTIAAFVDALERANELLMTDDELRRSYVAEFTDSDRGLVDSLTLDSWSTKIDVEGLQRLAEVSETYGVEGADVDVETLLHTTAQ